MSKRLESCREFVVLSLIKQITILFSESHERINWTKRIFQRHRSNQI